MQSANETSNSENTNSSSNFQKSPVSENSNDSGINEDPVGVSESIQNHRQESLPLDPQVSNIENRNINESARKENGDCGGDEHVHRLNDSIHSKNQVVNNVNTDVMGDKKDISIAEEVEDKKKETNGQQKIKVEARKENMENEVNEADDSEDEWMDVLGSGQLKKQVLRKAENSYRPQNLQICEVNIEGRLEDGTVFEKLENFRFQLGDNEVIQGLDLVIPLMDVGEEALIEVTPRFAYGFPGLPPKIPMDATLTYKVDLLSAEDEPDLSTLTVSERSKIGNKKRERGNWWYERENYTVAIQCYRRAVEYLDESEGGIQIEKEEKSEVIAEDDHSLLEDRLKVFNNLAAAQMKIRSFDLALESVEKVLHCQPKNVKALFRKGKILAAKGETSEAISVIRQASQLEPESKTIKQELQRLLNLNRRETQMEQNMYKRMLGQKRLHEENSSKPSRFSQMRWGVVFGSIAAMVAGVVAYRYKFL